MPLSELISPEHLEYLKWVFLLCGAASLALAAVFLAVLWMRPRDDQQPPSRASEGDLANMMILLQTMRDLLAQQKDLARQLNETLDKKVEFVRETVDAAMTDLDTLRESMGKTAKGLASVNASIAELQDQAGRIRTELDKAHARTTDPQEQPGNTEHPVEKSQAAKQEQAELDLPQDPPELQVFSRPERPQVNPDLLNDWVGLDLSKDEDEEPEAEDVPDEVPEVPENPEMVREAFKTLLDLQMHKDDAAPQSLRPDAPVLDTAEDEPHQAETSKGNGRGRVTPLQARVYEYRDAGMTISEIAKEIGIGKGEVRLILSIRERT